MLNVKVGPCILRVARQPMDCYYAFGDMLETPRRFGRSPYLLNESCAIFPSRMKDSESARYDRRVRQCCCIRAYGGDRSG